MKKYKRNVERVQVIITKGEAPVEYSEFEQEQFLESLLCEVATLKMGSKSLELSLPLCTMN